MKIDHVTYQVGAHVLERREVEEFFIDLLGMKEIKPDEMEGGWVVRWFEDEEGKQIHLVEAGDGHHPIDLGLGHFCAVISRASYLKAIHLPWCERNSDSGRAWLRGPGDIRVEIRPVQLKMERAEPIGLNVDSRGRAEFVTKQGPIRLGPLPTDEQLEQVFERCLLIFRERNRQHNDSWKREGWRGCLFNLRRKVERAWDHLWNLDNDDRDSDYMEQHVDDLLDAINYAGLSVISVETGSRDGSWKYDA